jgi:hypothetical protein
MIRRGIRFHANFLPQPLTFLTVDYREILDRLERRGVPVNRNIAPLGPLGQAVAGHRGFRIWLSVAGSFLLLVLATEIIPTIIGAQKNFQIHTNEGLAVQLVAAY